MDEKLTKSLTELIDETLFEIEELKKSRFSASEIKIEGPGDGIDGKPSDGSLEKEEDKKEEDKEEKKDDKKEDMDKAEDKKEDDKDEDDKEDMDKAECMDKKEDKKEDEKKDDEHEKKEKELAGKLLDMHKEEVKKSLEVAETLHKAYVDEKLKPFEDKLSTILELINKMADEPVAPKGATARTTPLFKSADESGAGTLSKSEVSGKLFDLKKSGTKVDTLDITKADLGQDLEEIVKKYKIS